MHKHRVIVREGAEPLLFMKSDVVLHARHQRRSGCRKVDTRKGKVFVWVLSTHSKTDNTRSTKQEADFPTKTKYLALPFKAKHKTHNGARGGGLLSVLVLK